jgi:Fe-S-cluster containining protein
VPIFYECERCTACCRWPGQVRVTDGEITRLAAFKGISEHAFIQQFTRLRHDRRGLALQEKPDGSCVFLDGNDCSVQPVKPQQCRDFPNLWKFSRLRKNLPRPPAPGERRGLPASGGRRHGAIARCGGKPFGGMP